MFLVSVAQAQEAAATTANTLQSGPIASLLPLFLILGVFYFLLIRPQSKKLKAHETMIKNLKRNDRVVTAGGIIGKITKVLEHENIVEVEIAPDVKVQVNRTTIAEVITLTGSPANDDKTAKEPSAKSKKAK